MSTFKSISLSVAFTFIAATATAAQAGDSRGRIVTVAQNQSQVEIQLNDNQSAQEGTVYRVTHYRAGPPKDPTSNVYLYAGLVRVTMPMGDGRAHAQVLEGHPAPGDTVRESTAPAKTQ